MMTKAATRLFSSPTAAGSIGGLAGAQTPSVPPDASNASMNTHRLSGSGSVDFPGDGRAPMAGGGLPQLPAPGGGARGSAPVGRGGPSGIVGGAGPGAATATRLSADGGKSPGGESKIAANGGAAVNSAAVAGAAAGSNSGNLHLNPMGANGVAPAPNGPSLDANSEAAAAPSAGAGGGGGSGGGGSGMGGKLSGGGKPKEPAGKPAGVDTSAATAGGGPSNGGSAGEAEGPTAKVGEPDIEDKSSPSGNMFSLKPGGPPVIATHIYRTKTQKEIVGYRAPMTIDDGNGGAGSLNPRVVPFIVIPEDFPDMHPPVELGDYASLTHGGKTFYAIIGARGPKGVLGASSAAAAKGFGINSDIAGVEYRIIPGSRNKSKMPSTSLEVQEDGSKAFKAAGAPLR